MAYIRPTASAPEFRGFGDVFDRTADQRMALEREKMDKSEARAKRVEALQIARNQRMDAKQATRDAQTKARYELADKRYEDEKLAKETLATENLNAELDAARSSTGYIDAYNTETVEDKANVVRTDYDTDALEKNIDAVPEVFQYDKANVSQNDLEKLKDYEEVNQLEDRNDKVIALDGLLKKYYPKEYEEEKAYGGLGGLAKRLGGVASTVGHDILAPVGQTVVNTVLDTVEEAKLQKNLDSSRKTSENYYNSSEQKMSSDIDMIRKKLDKNTRNKSKQNKTQEVYDKFLEKFKTKDVYGTKEVQTPKERKEFLSAVETQIQSEMNDIPETIKGNARAKRELAIRKKYDKQVVDHAKSLTDRAKQLASRKEATFKAQLKNASDKSLAKYKHLLDIAEEDYKNSPEDLERERRLKDATIEWKLAQAEKARRNK